MVRLLLLDLGTTGTSAEGSILFVIQNLGPSLKKRPALRPVPLLPLDEVSAHRLIKGSGKDSFSMLCRQKKYRIRGIINSEHFDTEHSTA